MKTQKTAYFLIKSAKKHIVLIYLFCFTGLLKNNTIICLCVPGITRNKKGLQTARK
jgi:hypothetical protein